jgi:hypothetical protein
MCTPLGGLCAIACGAPKQVAMSTTLAAADARALIPEAEYMTADKRS